MQQDQVNNESSDPILENEFMYSNMSMVDWRWASAKGFWDRNKQCWNEEMGGQAAYLAQRAMKRRRNHLRKGFSCIKVAFSTLALCPKYFGDLCC